MPQSGYSLVTERIASNRTGFLTVIGELSRGKSIIRATFNAKIQAIPIAGQVLDLGARSRSSSYYRFLNTQEAKITFTDINPTAPGMIKVDLEQPLPFPDQSFDVTLMMFVTNYIWNIGPLFREIRRVTRDYAIIGSSLVDQYAPEPHDYHRFTRGGLERLITEAGFTRSQVFGVEQGPLTLALAGLQQLAFFPPGAVALYPLVWAGDGLIRSVLPRRCHERSVMSYISVMKS
ncbi:putative Class I SAM-dependent methyltransferase [uncultured Gammaproteobacteria bacterium]